MGYQHFRQQARARDTYVMGMALLREQQHVDFVTSILQSVSADQTRYPTERQHWWVKHLFDSAGLDYAEAEKLV
jgi:hypothetical protein